MSRGRAQSEQRDELPGFELRLSNFEGPFDLLLDLISRRELDITEVALSAVTDEFIAYVKLGGEVWDLDRTSSFLVVAATLLDLKAARLLPGGEVSDPEDIAALEARDLLFARLLQYRAFKKLAEWVAESMNGAESTHWRPGGIEEQFRGLLPEVELTLTPDDVARLAAAAMVPKPAPVVELGHLHGNTVSVPEQVTLIADRLRREGAATFRSLISGADRLTVVVRFLAILELFRAQQVALEQLEPLAELTVRWTAGDEAAIEVTDDYGPQPELEDA
ncbi:segregation/condensation protein A [Tessaracoccus sp. MC1865]|uniref:segregation and condensation protein A n=1 Tax=Tessaracoccus sp. MC1865 TaxID=2760310 RepID=UPI001603025C|nr:segregation/condensation protein A [Tessaracoccus sp. MC1865]MBB1484944.1 segregation/condensation protein A [Tessaracoccus sp. MC1865]QTO38623.1 segregation/condensation protein A [Tessaracoccus sp. MC1865]